MPIIIPSGAHCRNQRDRSEQSLSKEPFPTILTFTMDPEFTIRDAAIEDAPAIARVNYLTWLHAYRGVLPDSEIDSLNLDSLTDQWIQNLSAADSRSGTFVVMKGATLIAYSRFYPSVDPDDDQARVATIGSMYVDPEFQRRGVGRKLMGAVLEAAREREYAEGTLHVLTANKRAQEFYESLGWERDLDADIAGSADEGAPKVRYRKSPL